MAEKELSQYQDIGAISSATKLAVMEGGRNAQAPASVLASFVGTQLDVSGIPADLEALKAGQSSNAIYVASWAELSSVAGTFVGQGAFVTSGDTGSHVDATSGLRVTNTGQYQWTGAVWRWLDGNVLAQKADKAIVEPMVPVVDRLGAAYLFGALPGYAFNFTCPHPTLPEARIVAGGVLNDGTNKWHTGEYVDLKVTGDLDAAIRALPSMAIFGYASNTLDGSLRAAGGTTDEGVLHYNEARFEVLNGFPVESLIYGHKAYFDGQVNYIQNAGQSLAEGQIGALTTAQEYDSVGFPSHSTAPTAWAPLTAANCSTGGNREMPVFGLCAAVKQLIEDEDGVDYTQQDYQLLSGNSGYSGRSMAQLQKGTAPYAEMIGQVQAGYSIAQEQGRRFVASALAWVQGPGDYLNGYRYYLSRQIALAKDFDADCRAITGQTRPVITLISQSASQGAAYRRPVPLAQLEASMRSAFIVLAAPEYQFKYLPDGMKVHIDAASTRLMGAYLGLALKRTLIDGKKWRPLMPSNIDVQGRVIYIRFNRAGLKIDTTLVPEQPQYGFSLLDVTGSEIALSNIEVVQPDTIRLVADSTPPPGARLWLGGSTAVGIDNYAGGASNIRDSQGDDLLFDGQPLHNWAVVFAAKL